jgi:hypothetical protein
MATRRSAAKGRVALFVEGTGTLTPRGRNDLLELWRYQCSRVSAFPPDQLDVYGFNKQQIVIMDPAHAAMPGAGKIPLDVAIEQRFRAKPFQALIVAFDAYPANQAIELVPGEPCPCLRVEKDFVLQRFAASSILPARFRASASSLLTHYQANRSRSRAPTRPPLGDVELIYMEPMFEALLLQDKQALHRVFGLKKTPKAWPALVSARPATACPRTSRRSRGAPARGQGRPLRAPLRRPLRRQDREPLRELLQEPLRGQLREQPPARRPFPR